MLPLWVRGGKPIVIPSPKRHLTLPTLPILLLLLGTGFLLHSLFFSPSVPASLAPAGKYTSSPFLVKPSDFIGPPPPDRPSYIPEPVEPKKKGMLVPDAVHYVYGLKPVPEGQRGEELPYYAYLAMRSALINLSPKVIYFHYEHLPTGPWWDLIRPHLTLIKTQVPESIYGRPLKHFAHKADVLRLLAMKYSGGIYLDIDIYVTKPFDDLLYYPTTLGMEASPDSRRSALDPEGLCQLAREHPTEIQVLSERAFFWPMWHGDEIKKTHETSQHDFKASGQYAQVPNPWIYDTHRRGGNG
ncbi:hypothetical protein CNBG_9579 [Cryptococcus deuterogattii R265]|uniref:uncharacterized protein n=1 Tax=Cryptococcus deuterogattii (strain R265) TaxID=294750 RepID=UPI0019389A5B|nr:hypothetical protein CNBG_9579 [Cryptococcus deuterogattii R265]